MFFEGKPENNRTEELLEERKGLNSEWYAMFRFPTVFQEIETTTSLGTFNIDMMSPLPFSLTCFRILFFNPVRKI